MDRLIELVLLFFAYSFAGWVIEVTLKAIQYRRFINRGFLTGPWLPIYGSGAALITVAAKCVPRGESSVSTTFLMSFLLCGLVEYSVSFWLEKRFHARWWDYSQKPMNLHGRVWIGNLTLFGLGGLFIVYAGNPFLIALFDRWPAAAKDSLAGALAAVFIADAVISHFVMRLVKTGVEHSAADNTEDINREVRRLMQDRSYFHRRFADAYPNVIYQTDRVKKRMEEIRAETERLRREAERRRAALQENLTQRRDQLAASLEPSSAVRQQLMQKQEALIDLIYDESQASAEARALKAEIDARRSKLDSRLSRRLLGR